MHEFKHVLDHTTKERLYATAPPRARPTRPNVSPTTSPPASSCPRGSSNGSGARATRTSRSSPAMLCVGPRALRFRLDQLGLTEPPPLQPSRGSIPPQHPTSLEHWRWPMNEANERQPRPAPQTQSSIFAYRPRIKQNGTATPRVYLDSGSARGVQAQGRIPRRNRHRGVRRKGESAKSRPIGPNFSAPRLRTSGEPRRLRHRPQGRPSRPYRADDIQITLGHPRSERNAGVLH